MKADLLSAKHKLLRRKEALDIAIRVLEEYIEAKQAGKAASHIRHPAVDKRLDRRQANYSCYGALQSLPARDREGR